MSEVTTYMPEATTKHFELDSIHKRTELDLKVLKEGAEESRKQHMIGVFEKIRGTGGKMTIIEADAQGSKDKTDVVFRQPDTQGRLSGRAGIRLPHGTEVALAKEARYLISGTGADKHVYIKVSYGGKEGYIASEHLRIKENKPTPPNTNPKPPVIDPKPDPGKEKVPTLRTKYIKVPEKTTYGEFAKKWKTTVDELNKINHFTLKIDSEIEKDKGILIPIQQNRTKSPTLTAPAKENISPVPTEEKSDQQTYIVKPGDNLSKIARENHITPQALMEANSSIKDKNSIKIGQKLIIPSPPDTAYGEDEPDGYDIPTIPGIPLSEDKPSLKNTPHIEWIGKTKTAENWNKKPTFVPKVQPTIPPFNDTFVSVPSAAEPAPAESKENKIRPITLDTQITYGALAEKYNTTVDRLNDLNGLDLTDETLLEIGSQLYVPAVPETDTPNAQDIDKALDELE